MSDDKQTGNIELEYINIESVEDVLGDADFDIAKEKFSLAKNILLCLFSLTILIIIVRAIFGSRTGDDVKDIFSTVFQSIVPMSSLVIGYYFGSKGSKE